MDDGELDFSNHEMFSGTNIGDIPSSGSMDSFFDDIFDDTHVCTHTHTCHPRGPNSSHTHTCYHAHSKIVSTTSDDDKTPTDDTAESLDKNGKKRPSGNREAVRKYREKKKARTASLEDEVVRLRALNQQLMKRVQSQVGLEAEVARLKCLLVDVRGRIDGEIGSFPYRKQQSGAVGQGVVEPNLTGGFMLNRCNVSCGASIDELSLNGCDFENLRCLRDQDPLLDDLMGRGDDDGFPDLSARAKRRGCR